MSGNPSVLSS